VEKPKALASMPKYEAREFVSTQPE